MKKSKFCVKQLNFLGYVLDEFGLGTDPSKITPILNIPPPKNLTELRRIIGIAGWYRRFIKNFSDITNPITELLKNKNKKKFEWSEEADVAFKKLKTALVSAPVLRTSDYTQQFTIQTDASETGIGAVLTQGTGSDEHVIAYMSGKLSTAQRKYSATERECLAVIEGINKFRSYVEGTHFRVITDHSSLLWLKNLKDPQSRLARWALKLQQYDCEFIHRKGKLNVIADALSRAVEIVDIHIEDDNDLDDEYVMLKNKITSNPSKFPKFTINENLVYKNCRVKTGASWEDNGWKLYVPLKFRQRVLFESHDSPNSSHLGVCKTVHRILEKYYWPRMIRDVREYVKTCEQCQLSKHPNYSTRVPMGNQKVVEGPWDSISIDFLGPFPRSRKGNTYIFVVVDNFSKWCMLKPLRKADTKSVVEYLVREVFLVYGVPTKIICDNGPQFTSKEFHKMLDQYKITPHFNPVYHPQHNPAERPNRVILSRIRAYTNGDQTNWDLHIPQIAWALRTAFHEGVGLTPFMINFGRTANVDGTRIPITDQSPLKPDERLAKLENIWDFVRKNLVKSYEKNCRTYNLRTRPILFVPGEIVLRKSYLQSNALEKFNAKLANQYIKCKIQKKIGNVTYIIEDLKGKFIGKYHANDLRKYNHRENINQLE